MEKCFGSNLKDELAIEYSWINEANLKYLAMNTFIAAIDQGVWVLKLIQGLMEIFFACLLVRFADRAYSKYFWVCCSVLFWVLSHVEFIPILSSYPAPWGTWKCFQFEQLQCINKSLHVLCKALKFSWLPISASFSSIISSPSCADHTFCKTLTKECAQLRIARFHRQQQVPISEWATEIKCLWCQKVGS